MSHPTRARFNRVSFAVAALAAIGLAACGSENTEESLTGPLLAPEPPANPEIVSAAFIADVNRVTGEINITAPTQGYDPQILADFFGLEPGSPDLSILAGDVVEILAQNPVFSDVGDFLPGLVRTQFDIAIRNRLSVINLIAPTFPVPPAGTGGPLVIPFEVVVTTTPGGVTGGAGDGTDVIVELPNRGDIAPSVDFDNAPFNFFNDDACAPTDNDCYRSEEFAPVAGGATSAFSTVGFDHDPTVSQFRTRMIVAADIENATPNVLPSAAIVGPASAAIGATATFDASGSADTDGFIANYEFFVDGTSAQSGSSSSFGFACTAAGTFTISVTVTDDRSGTDSASQAIDCLAIPAVEITKLLDGTDTNTAEPGSQFTYTLAVSSVGTGPATNVVATDVLPAGVSFVSVDNAACAEAAGTVTCTFPSLADGSTETINILVDVTAAVGTDITNVADVTSDDAGSDSDDHILQVRNAPNLFGRWVDASGAPITSALVGETVFFQLCTSISDASAYQSDVTGFGAFATNVSNDDLDSAGTGVHPDCVGTDDQLDDFFTASGTTDPVNFLITRTGGPGTGTQGIAEFEFTLTAPGTLQIVIPEASIVPAGTYTADIAPLTIS